TFTYIRFKAFLQEEPKIDDADRRDNFAYRFGVIYLYQSMHFGLVFQGHEGRVLVAGAVPKSMGGLVASVGDFVLYVAGRRMRDADKTVAEISSELESKGFVKVVMERANASLDKAKIEFAIGEMRDPPVPADCADYVKKALAAVKKSENKSILRPARASDNNSTVAFHDNISTESVIPSDIQDDALNKTPARVPPNFNPQQQQPPTDNEKVASVMAAPEPEKKTSGNRKEKGSKKKSEKGKERRRKSAAEDVPAKPKGTSKKAASKKTRKTDESKTGGESE
ncbi:hypothetical protein PFISCL1PPCAC_3868, partial [Pristionchus fissidentatus]